MIFTILVLVVRFIVSSFSHSILLSIVLGVRLLENIPIGGASKPVRSGFEVIWDTLIVIFLARLANEGLGIVALGSDWEISSGVAVGWLNILIHTFVSWESTRIAA